MAITFKRSEPIKLDAGTHVGSFTGMTECLVRKFESEEMQEGVSLNFHLRDNDGKDIQLSIRCAPSLNVKANFAKTLRSMTGSDVGRLSDQELMQLIESL